MDISNASAVITGGTEGIGLATALGLGRAGAKVVLCSRTEKKVKAALDTLAAENITAWGTTCDVTEPDSVAAFAGFACDKVGDPDILVNNAGIGLFGPIDELTLEQFDTVMATNVRSLFLVTRAFISGMKTRGSGHIVNVASLAGRNGFPGGTAYSASKHAALGFSKSLLLETRKYGLRVIAVCPGSVDTPFFDKAGIERDNRDRILTAEDVATTIVNALQLPENATVSELDIRPANP